MPPASIQARYALNKDELPYPDYEDYFEQFRASWFRRDWQPSVFLETSRGCWWGEKMHCTFCGLNGQTMAYRSKAPFRALKELADLTAKHPGCDVEVTDNILDMKYFKNFLPELGQRRLGVELFYETKANLKKEQVRTLRTAGVRRIQPGIESFSDSVLQLMRKGVTGLQNIQLLKWCKELGLEPYWNLLWGFPGEAPEDYARMAETIPLLVHLPAPLGGGAIRLDRFSPNFFDAEKLGFANVVPLAPYRHIYYPLSDEVLANLACYFTFTYREPRDVDSYVRPLAKELKAWQRDGGRSDLFSVDTGDCLLLWDLRPVAREPLTVIRGLERSVYQALDSASDLPQVARILEGRGDGSISPAEIERRLDPLLTRGLLVRDGSRYLALAIPLGDYAPPARAAERFYEVARALGRQESGGLSVPLNGDSRVVPTRRSKAKARPRRRIAGRRPLTLSPSQFTINERGELLIRRIPTEAHRTKGEVDAQEKGAEEEEARWSASERTRVDKAPRAASC